MTLIDETGTRVARYVTGYRRTLEASCWHLRAQAGEPNHIRAKQIPRWASGLAFGTKLMAFAQLGPVTLYVAELTKASKSWKVASERIFSGL